MGEPFSKPRIAKFYVLHAYPYQRADIVSNTYLDWMLNHIGSTLNKMISPTTGKLTGIDTLVVAGARLRVRF